MKKEYIQPLFMAIDNEVESSICATSPGTSGYDYGGGSTGGDDKDSGSMSGGGGGNNDDDEFNQGAKSSWGTWND